jgi:hypothetical protein
MPKEVEASFSGRGTNDIEFTENGAMMRSRNRVCAAGTRGALQFTKGAARTGWQVIRGSGAPAGEPVSRETVKRSGLRLVEAKSSSSFNKQEPVANATARPKWLKAMWVASAVASGWALYWVSVAV